MKKFKLLRHDECESIELTELLVGATVCSNKIIAYTTGGGGCAVLREHNGSWGFSYHSDILSSNSGSMSTRGYLRHRFTGRTAYDAVKRAVSSGRDVLVFESANEFIIHSGDKAKFVEVSNGS